MEHLADRVARVPEAVGLAVVAASADPAAVPGFEVVPEVVAVVAEVVAGAAVQAVEEAAGTVEQVVRVEMVEVLWPVAEELPVEWPKVPWVCFPEVIHPSLNCVQIVVPPI